ncbi:putative Rhodanese domain protein [Desulfamplus magnetovallimortis]|uniref:Putative Rhodanese domain protein n=1 Tax=Desulfamplus magnetovallimortis TaxID=1246637 RepID=A0A1W1HAQ3_9BACT|nr:rhodanese-like domain-containing protein [Desulfamplus magnetovallimortis]SLM29571.1 putative Rhodanese domain protein [Desulfamplus magnetovallimortis]
MKTITPEELREYREKMHEKSYILIDVRQKPEYEEGHIPGSVLLPLDEFEDQVESLPEKNLIFYCRSGGRSNAAALTADFFNEAGKDIYNLEGGILAWDGIQIEGLPMLKLFNSDIDDGMDKVLVDAMNLEKGAFHFYSHIIERFPESGLNDVISQVRDGELGHAKLIYSHLKNIKPDVKPFEDIYDALKGDILEGGYTLDEMVNSLEKRSDNILIDILETSITMEYRAFDLYRVVADKAEDEKLKDALYGLSQAEKAHMAVLIKSLESSI